MRRTSWAAGAVAPSLLSLVLAPSRASAYDADVRADTIAQAYEVRGPTGTPVITSRRITQTLTLDVVQRPTHPHGITVSFHVRLRFDADFGQTCDPSGTRCLDETNRDRSGEFVPTFSPQSLDVPYAYLDVSGIGHGAVDLRVGRMLEVDPLGFFVFDGARARIHAGDYVILEALGGLETRSGFLLSNGRFERDGIIRADRTGWDPTLAPYATQLELAPVIGIAAETAMTQPVFARVSYRRVWTTSGVAEDNVGGHIDARITDHVRVFGEAVYSIPLQALVIGSLSAEWRNRYGLAFALDASRFRPMFDLSSIWASFWTDSTDEVRARTDVPLTQHIELTGAATLRRYALSETGPSPNGPMLPDEYDFGGSAGIALRMPAYRVAMQGHAEGGAVSARGGIDASGSWWCIPNWVRLDGSLSLWESNDDLRPDRSGLSAGGVIGATVRLGALADLHADVEDDVNRFVGNRFRALTVLTIRGVL